MNIPAVPPTRIRYVILALTVSVAVLLYLDRFCLGFVLPFLKENFRLTDFETNFLVGAFFYTYAFGQIAGGYLSDRFGARLMLALYLAIWSALTGVMGLATGFVMLVMMRFGCGLFEAGAYPACAGIIRRWVPYQQRGLASGIISLGGRIGGTVAPVMTAYLMVLFMPVSHSSLVTDGDLLKPQKLVRDVLLMQKSEKKLPEVVVAVAPQMQAKLSPEALAAFREIAAQPDDQALTPAQIDAVVNAVNAWLKQPDLLKDVDRSAIDSKLTKQMRELMQPMDSAKSTAEVTRQNRLLLEILFPDSIRKIYGGSWQPALMLYGGFGVLLAVFFWFFFRDTPRQHFLANDAEADLAEAHEKATETSTPIVSPGELWRGLLTNTGLWASSVVQFGTNFGWIFLGSMMPTFLQRIFPEVSVEDRGLMSSLPFFASLPMMILGGFWTDWMAKRFGPYVGRSFPVAITRFVAAGAFLACCYLDSPWAITFVLCIFSVTNDMGIPALWAYNLDVGKANVGLVLGWGNMWGNLGAAVAPMLLGFVIKRYVDFDGVYSEAEARAGYNAIFLTCAGVFIFIGLASFFIDATKKIGVAVDKKA